MKKYEMLVEEYSGTIARIKSLQKRRRATSARYEAALLEAPDPSYQGWKKAMAIGEELGEIDAELREEEEQEELDYAIHKEYEACPYQKTREAGIRAFYRAAELD